MNLKEVHRILHDFFQKPLTNERKRNLVFWYDEEGEFAEDIEEIDLPGVRKWIMTENNLFATKYELEKNDPKSHFLLYANMPKPNPKEDWLYDQFRLGHEFATDKITITMRELSIVDNSLREKFKQYRAFFNSRTRFAAFRKFPVDAYTHEIVDLTVLAALAKSKTNAFDDIVKALMRAFTDGNPKPWVEIEKYAEADVFWGLAEKYYGYLRPDKSLKSLFISLAITHISESNQTIELPKTWQKYVSSKAANVIVFMGQWMSHLEDRDVYNTWADETEDVIRAAYYANEWEMQEILLLDAFRVYDEKIILYLAEQLACGLTDFQAFLEIIATRRKLHWYPEYKQEYEAIFHAVQLLLLLHEKDYFILEQSASKMFSAYADDFYRIDTAYRKFYVFYDRIENKEKLFKLRETIENVYANRFLQELALKWTMILEKTEENGWPIAGVSQQKNFYRNSVEPYQANDERIFVIISDALRYDIAKELADILNNERKATTEIAAIQSIIPSYTALGMASLLPHRKLEYAADGNVVCDGMSTAGIVNRKAIIEKKVPDSLAIDFHEIAGMNRNVLRETLQGKKVIYIYHNAIDARGDNAKTNMEVFDAAEEAIHDIRLLVNQLVNNVSASNVLITADHGFLYQRDAIEKSQKLPRAHEHALAAGRRFFVSNKKESSAGTFTYAMNDLQEEGTNLFVTVPKGINRFAIQGAGANYVHGGAMLQEIVVPVITFKNDRSKSSANIVKKVNVKLTTPTRKITNNMTYLTFLQTERIEEKKRPLRLNVYFADEDGERISNENIIIADSRSHQPRERTFREKFVFKAMKYEKQKTYYLVLEDEEEKADKTYERYPFTIDIAFSAGDWFPKG